MKRPFDVSGDVHVIAASQPAAATVAEACRLSIRVVQRARAARARTKLLVERSRERILAAVLPFY